MNRLIVVVGPTAVGKSDFAMELARKFDCEIISGDSMCVYRRMDIGTAKASQTDQAEIPHHLVDIRDLDEDFSVVDFQRLASDAIAQINLRGKIPVLVGGTGLYVQALLEGYQFSPTAKTELRVSLLENGEDETAPALLHQKLSVVDPEAALRIHPNDRKRLLRALEVAQMEQRPISRQKAGDTPDLLFDCLVFGLAIERPDLYQRIDDRVGRMVGSGLVEEVRELLAASGSLKLSTALQAIGYKEIVAYLQGAFTLPEAISQVKQSSRRYAKRQMTWFRRMNYIHWMDPNKEESLTVAIRQVAEKFAIK